MKNIICLFYLNFLLLAGYSGLAQSIELQGTGGIDCADNKFYLSIKIQATDVNSFALGNSTIYIDYDPNVLSFDALTFSNFKANQLCTNGAAPWSAPTYNGEKSGVLVMTTILTEGGEAFSCPSIGNSTWVEVAQASFDVQQIPDEGDLLFNITRTNFNKNLPNNGDMSIDKGDFTMIVNNCQGDFDADGIMDVADNCPTTANPNQEDADLDGIGDVCDDSCLGLMAYMGPDRLACEGENSLLLASGLGGTQPYSYLWSTGETASVIEINPNGSLRYTLTVTDAIGCVGVDTLLVSYTTQALDSLYFYDQSNGLSFATIEDGTTYYLADFPSDFNIEAATSGIVSSVHFSLYYQNMWLDNDTDNTSPWRISNDWLPGQYQLVIRSYSEDNAVGTNCVYEVVNFTLLGDCPITDTGIDPQICPTETVTLSAAAQGLHPPFSYLWRDSLFTFSMTTESITVSPELTTAYFLRVTDANGCFFTDRAVVHVNPSAPNCDIDADGILNLSDPCPYTEPNAVVNAFGCTDDDLDGTFPDAILSDPDFDPNDNNACVPGIYTINFALSLLLEGPLTDAADPDIFLQTMRSDLSSTSRFILPGMSTTPSGQPFSSAPWNYTGTEGAGWTSTDYENLQSRTGKLVVDWVLVSFRSSPAAEDEFVKVAGLLLNDGTVDFLGACFLSTAYQPEDIYIVVEHRNHLGIMTASPALVANQALVYDFISQNSYLGPASQGAGQKEVSPDRWAMFAGDAAPDLNGYDINILDRVLWEAQNGSFSLYRPSDLNLDGDVNAVDRILWQRSNGLFSRVFR